MMKYAVRYYSKSGHTKKLATAIADTLGVQACDISCGLDDDVDVLFLGTSIYGNAIDPVVVDFFNRIDVDVGCIVNFSTSGVGRSTYDEIKQLTESYEIKMCEDEFYCIGEFAGINQGHPDSKDIEDVVEFVKKFI